MKMKRYLRVVVHARTFYLLGKPICRIKWSEN